MSRRFALILLASALVIGGAGGALWWLDAHVQEVLTDDSSIEQPLDRAQPRDILWQPPAALPPDTIPAGATGGAFHDGRFAFAAPGPDGDLDLFEAIRTPRAWETRRLGEASSPDRDTTPAYSPDGQWLYFASDRPGGAGGLDLWRSPATDSGWGSPEHVALADLLPSADDESSPAFSPDAALLAYARRADAGSPADLVLVSLRDPAAPALVEHPLNTPEHDERSPAFSPAGDFLYFASDRPDGAGGLDLYRARLTNGIPADPAWLGEEVNSAADEIDPALTLAGFRLRFRTVPAEHAGAPAGDALPTDIAAGYRETTAREVYRTTRSRWPSLGVSDELLRLLPWLLLLLALALLFSALRRLAAGEIWQRRWRTLGLMSRCVLASMALHALLALLLSIWRVETTLPGLEEGSEARVRLTSHAAAAGAAAQLNAAALSALPAPAPASAPAAAPAPSEAREYDLAAADTTARPAFEAPSDASPGAPAPVAYDPATAPPSAAPPSLPSATPTQVAEARSRDAPIQAGRSLPRTAARPAERAVLEPATTVASGAGAFEVSDAVPAPAPEAARHNPAPSTQLAMETPALPQANPGERSAPAEERSAASGLAASSAPPSVELPGRARVIAEAPAPSKAVASVAGAVPIDSAPAPATSRAIDAPPTSIPSLARAQLPTRSPGEAVESQPDATEPAPSITTGESPSPSLAAGPRSARPMAIAAAPTRSQAVTRDSLEAAPALSAPTPTLPLAMPKGAPAMLPVARVIAGVVVNDDTGAPIPGALVRLDGEGDLIRSATVGEDGRFSLTPAELPEFAALTASADGYAPTAANIAERDVGDGMWIELRLEPASRFELALDPEPRVHHLGNDQFTGSINSQFQVRSQGTRYTATFRLEAEQLERPIRVAELHLLVRGAQNHNPIFVNGEEVEAHVTDSPEDGSFGAFIARIPLEWLREGDNEIEIHATQREGTDIDDFEFVNPRLLLKRRGSAPRGGYDSL
ncbi:MAG TPA: carboxypeptidase regulatory-like domain-containing protein [Phycisphaerales bacterium]|nr:carboxypeptidase regulatory-like domain-containing protein [Phycisphaerales bacterium]